MVWLIFSLPPPLPFSAECSALFRWWRTRTYGVWCGGSAYFIFHYKPYQLQTILKNVWDCAVGTTWDPDCHSLINQKHFFALASMALYVEDFRQGVFFPFKIYPLEQLVYDPVCLVLESNMGHLYRISVTSTYSPKKTRENVRPLTQIRSSMAAWTRIGVTYGKVSYWLIPGG